MNEPVTYVLSILSAIGFERFYEEVDAVIADMVAKGEDTGGYYERALVQAAKRLQGVA